VGCDITGQAGQSESPPESPQAGWVYFEHWRQSDNQSWKTINLGGSVDIHIQAGVGSMLVMILNLLAANM